MKITEMITAPIMTGMLFTMPTAVITESSENTMSSNMIWISTAVNDDTDAPRPAPLALQLAMDLLGTFRHKEQPPDDHDQIPPAQPVPEYSDPRLRQPRHPRNRQQQEDPHDHRQPEPDHPRPVLWCFGSLPARIE